MSGPRVSEIGAADVAVCRQDAEEAVMEYAKALQFWNAPDDEHSRICLRAMVEEAIAEVFRGQR